jgi:hypothetical protein
MAVEPHDRSLRAAMAERCRCDRHQIESARACRPMELGYVERACNDSGHLRSLARIPTISD